MGGVVLRKARFCAAESSPAIVSMSLVKLIVLHGSRDSAKIDDNVVGIMHLCYRTQMLSFTYIAT